MTRQPFRETLWFKVGDLGEPEQPLPIEDAYVDDGQVSGRDTLDHGVHSGKTVGWGSTRAMPRVVFRSDDAIEMDRRMVQAVAHELRRSSTQIAAVVGASIIVIAVVCMLAF